MSGNIANVDVAITGVVAYAPTATAAPTDADTALNVAFKDVGFISEDGIVETRDRSTNNIIAWQNSEVVRTVVTEASISVQFKMIETNANSLELYYGAAVDPTDGSVDIVPAETGGRRAFVIDYVDGDKFVRLYLPEGEVTTVGELTNAAGEAVGYDVTVVGYKSQALGCSARKFFSALVDEG